VQRTFGARFGNSTENPSAAAKSERTAAKSDRPRLVADDVKTTRGVTMLGVVLALAGCDAPQHPQDDGTSGAGIEVPQPEVEAEEDPFIGWDDDLPADHDPNCGESSIAFEFATPDVMLVLDKSGSMAANTWDHDRDGTTPEVTRWASLHQVVDNVTGEFDERMRLGAVLFPAIDAPNQSNALACMMGTAPDAAVSAMGGQAVLDAMPAADATNIFGGTPATAGVRLAAEHLQANRGEDPQAIVLITDGAANCAADASGSSLFLRYDDALPVAVAEAYAAGIPVYVVGIDIEDEVLELPIANPWERLSEVADHGGVPRDGAVPFYDVFDELELDAALSSIANDVSCSVPVVDAFDPRRLSLTIDGEAVPRVEHCDDGEGWMADGPDRVRLCADTCGWAQVADTVDAVQQCVPEP